MELLPLILSAPLLAWMAYSDLRYMRIPNWLVIGLAVAFLVCVPFLPVASVGARAGVAAGVLVVGFVAFALGFLGGGDAKVLSALLLLVPPGTWAEFALLFSATLLVGLGLVLSLRLAPGAARSTWVGLRARGMFPMGVSIGLAGLLHPVIASQLLY
ncbi:A24 family peptidase [Tropicimonas marinistellae]|uniref:A24 family peptidase n=1 Tax=Tropicimonas marinistellae TaxID=1739787 RepID=UPI00082E954A|nr:prepilin peptidase [Tropicimonas marinistellae]